MLRNSIERRQSTEMAYGHRSLGDKLETVVPVKELFF